MHHLLWSWRKTVSTRSRPRRLPSPWPRTRLRVERLEDRTLLSGDTLATAALLPFTAFHNAHAAGFLATPNEVDLYRLHLSAGDQIRAAVSAQTSGSGLQSLLRLFDA